MKPLPMIIVIAAMLAVPPAGFAVDEEANSNQQRRNRQSRSQASDSQSMRSSWRQAAMNQRKGQTISTSGEILRLKKVDLRGRDITHSVALLRTKQGKMGVVDLGPVKQLERLKLQQGDRIEVRGKPVVVNKRGVLMADAVRKSDRRVGVDRADRPARAAKKAVRRTDLRQVAARRRSQNSSKQSDTAKQRRMQRGHLSGKIVRTKQIDVRGSNEKQMVVLVETERGNRIAVDLGPTSQLKDAELGSGDRVRINGFMTEVGDKRLVVAEQLAVARRSDDRQGRDEGTRADRSRSDSSRRR